MKYLILFFLFSISNLAQEFNPAIPNKNIDSLICKTRAYEIYTRGEIETAMKISCKIDSSGILKEIIFMPMIKSSFNDFDSLFINEIKTQLYDIAWEPARYGNNEVSSTYSIPFVLILKNSQEYLNRHFGSKKSKLWKHSKFGDDDYSIPIIKIRNAPLIIASHNVQ